MKKKISLILEHKQCHSCKYWECANELGSFCRNKFVKTKNITGDCKQYKSVKPEPVIGYYKTTNGIFAYVILKDEKVTIEIKLNKPYKTTQEAKAALEKIGKEDRETDGVIGERMKYKPIDPIENLAKEFHKAYENLAPYYGYKTRKASAVPWDKVPIKNKRLMIAVCEQLYMLGLIK